MLYQITDGTVSPGGQEVLSHINFWIKGKEKLALVGANGAGKTTLLKLIEGELSLDRDDHRKGPGITMDRRLSIRMLYQTAGKEADCLAGTLFGCSSRLDSAADVRGTGSSMIREEVGEGFQAPAFVGMGVECRRLLNELGFSMEDMGRPLSSFSGGQQTKLLLIRELLAKPDILLLDEPTNHLDIETTEWLEAYLKGYDGAVVVVSHDRFFLDRIADGVWELQRGRLTRYSGNYTSYRKQRRKNLQIQRKQYEQQQAELARLNGLIEKFKHKPKKAAFARSRRSIIERMERVPKPVEEECHIFAENIEPEHSSSKWVVRTEKLKIGYGSANSAKNAVPAEETSGLDGRPGNVETGSAQNAIMTEKEGTNGSEERQGIMAAGKTAAWTREEITMRIRRGQKIGIIGANGVGKTTLLKTIAGLLEPLGGSCQLGERVEFGYFDQQTARCVSDDKKTVYDHFHDLFPGKTEKETRQQLAAWLFPGRDAAKRVCDLSGGEKSRLVLAGLLTARPNLLLLDEPTNHMDIPAKETIESAFEAYTGTLLFISHDRYFIRQVADALLVMDEDEVLYYPFGYEHYLERRDRKGLEGESLTAVIRAKDQAMVDELRAVPEAERHRLREIGTEQANYEWQLRLAAEAMEKASREAERLRRQCREAGALAVQAYWMEFFDGELKQHEEEELGQLELLEREAEAAWTKACLEWYEVYSSNY